MGFNPTRFVYVIQAQLVEEEVFDPYLMPECYTSRDEACKHMKEEAEKFLKENPDYEDDRDIANFETGEIELRSKDPNECFSFKLEVLELELYDTVKEAKGEA